ncbi:MAG: hypothetical protein IIC11_10390, partial [Proteobacteria bacterium]|nr:hypothetical protein [Pseudomonadota bacterium]
VFRQLRGAAGGGGMLGNFGRSKHRLTTKEHTNVSFSDVAGVEEAKEEVTEIIEFLKNPKRFQRLGGRIPRGVVLVGEIGGNAEELAAKYISETNYPKPVVAFIAGRSAPPEKRMGHAGAIVMGNMGTAKSKIDAFANVGVPVAEKPSDVVKLLDR